MASSRSIASLVARNALAVSGAKKHAKALPPKAAEAAASLAKRNEVIGELNARQESLKADLAKTTKALNDELKASGKERQQVIRFAEATFGPRAPEILAFRSKTEVRVVAGK